MTSTKSKSALKKQFESLLSDNPNSKSKTAKNDKKNLTTKSSKMKKREAVDEVGRSGPKNDTVAQKTEKSDKKADKSSKDELQDIFANIQKNRKKKGKIQQEEDKRRAELAKSEEEQEKKRRRTEDGLRIYSWKELNLGKGGDTELCPFDCDCCF